MALLGMRKAELLGLLWDAVDLEAGELEVRQTLQRVDGSLSLLPPKTRYSKRVIALPDFWLTALREHRARQLSDRLAAGPAWRGEWNLVFTTGRGTPIEPRNLNRHFYALRQRAGIAEHRFHELRHTAVSLLLDLGIPPHVVREIVGHSDIGVTMTIYAHASQEKRRALGQLGEGFSAGCCPPVTLLANLGWLTRWHPKGQATFQGVDEDVAAPTKPCSHPDPDHQNGLGELPQGHSRNADPRLPRQGLQGRGLRSPLPTRRTAGPVTSTFSSRVGTAIHRGPLR
jgi:Phage integrase family